ncbi:unnamed protein product [Caenorhabditis sp. 36 PRJEB53466]|nr:unnamed protein product [Caenorhabditis sp. 36 PRJEB53466]
MQTPTRRTIQIFCLPIALLTNCSLIFLICTRSPSKLGTYKYLMIFFAAVSVSYSCFEALLGPLLIVHGDCFQVVSVIQFANPNIDRYLLYYGCGFCGVITSMFVVHFIFRLFALERRGHLRYFDGFYFPCWLLIPILTGFVWTQALFWFMSEDAESSEYIRELMETEYNTSISDVVHVGVLYYKRAENGGELVNWKGIQGVTVLGSIMTICFVLITFFGTLTYKRIKLLVLQGRSEFTKRLQKQLYQALVIQTVIPIFFMIVPLSFFFFSPLFHFGAQWIGDVTTMTVAFYPIIDPLPVVFIVDNYRNAVFELIGVSKKPHEINTGSG